MDYDDRITKETWDLAELKWKSLAAGATIRSVERIHPVLATFPAGCSFCEIFSGKWRKCGPCPLRAGTITTMYPHCCDGLFHEWMWYGQSRKQAGAVLRFIRAERVKWEQHLSRSKAERKED